MTWVTFATGGGIAPLDWPATGYTHNPDDATGTVS